MPQSNRNFAFALLVCLVFFSACTDAQRWLNDKADSKAKPTPRAGDPSIALKTSPAVSQSPKASPASTAVFSGDLAGKTGKRLFYQLLEKNNKKPIKLDVLLSDEQLEQLHDIDKGKKWYFDLAYPGEDGYNTGGELLVDVSQGKGDLKLNGNHLTGSIVVTTWTGPKQGLMSIAAKPVIDDPPNTRKDEAKPTPSAQVDGKKKQSAANNPPI
ncbi:MAG: hypothetical protein JNM09_23325 [Blastocatellia bacterium]|nr:hypothetical protein [Blastocatellia bacterium]